MKILILSKIRGLLFSLILAVPTCFMLLPLKINAQQRYPVSVNVSISPPYSVYLTDYISQGSNKLMTTLIFNDYNENSWDVYLKIKIESSNLRITSRADFIPTVPITLTPGVPVQLNGDQLYQYFDFNNIDVAGMSKADLISSGRLIEGDYTFCFEVYDYKKHTPISIESCARVNLSLNDPSRLVLPEDLSVIALTTQDINFQWQQLGGDPTKTKFQLSIYELADYKVNPSIAVKENQAIKVFESPLLDNPFYLYGVSSPMLKRGKKYAWVVQSVTDNNRVEFKNQGFSQIRSFYFGYPENGVINITNPPNGHSFSLRETKTFRWRMPDNLTSNQQYYYKFNLVEVADGQLIDDAIKNNSSIFTKQSETLNSSNSSYEVTLSPNLFATNKQYAWQVTAFTNDQKIASSLVYNLYGPPLIEAFYAGNHVVYVTNTISPSLSDLSGEGEVAITYNGETQKVYFEHIKVERIGALLIMTKGIVKAKYQGKIIPLKAEYAPNGDATFNPDSLMIDQEYMRLKGVAKLPFPHPTVKPQNPVVQSKPAWIIFDNYCLIGRAYLKDSLNYELADPYGFNVNLETSSYFVLSNNNQYRINFNGKVTLPANVKNASGTREILPFQNTDKLDFIQQKFNPGSSSIELVKGTGINLLASSYIIDFSDTESPYKKVSQLDWKGVYFVRSIIEFPQIPDKSNQLFFKNPTRYTVKDSLNSNDSCWITTEGLQFKVNKRSELPDSLWFNTFSGVIDNYQFSIKDSKLIKGLFKGSIAIPLISETERFPFTIPITLSGFATGYLDQSLDGLDMVFNPNGGEQKIDITINRAVFANRERLDMNIDLKWPLMDISLKSLEGLMVWGNGNIGFFVPNGAYSLSQQVQTRIKGFEVNIDYVGCGRQENLYSFGTSSKIVMGEDISGSKGAPIANIYSITKNVLLHGNASASNMPDLYQNIIIESKKNSATGGENSIGVQQNDNNQSDSLKQVVFGKEVNDEAAAMLAELGNGGKANIDSTFNNLINTQEPETNPAYAGDSEVTVEKVVALIDLVTPFLNEEQQVKAQEFKAKLNEFDQNELVVLYRELSDFKQFIKKIAKELLNSLIAKINQPIIEQSNKVKGEIIGFIDKKSNAFLAIVDNNINKLVDELAEKATQYVTPDQRAGKESLITEIINSAATATKKGLTDEIERSVKASIKKNISDKIVGIIDSAVVLKVTAFVDSSLSRSGNAIIEKGFKADLKLDQIGNDAKNLLPSIGKDFLNRVLDVNLENTLLSTITDSYKGIRWDSVGNYIASQVLELLVEKKIMAAVTNAVVNTVTNLLGENGGAVAGALMQNINFDFSNIGDKLKNGRIDQIVKFDPSYIKVPTTVADFEGWVKFTDKDPLWGDSWQATLSAKIKTGVQFTATAKYVNGSISDKDNSTSTGKNFKYWFLEVGVDDLNAQLAGTPLTFDGAKGKVFHHMKRVGNATTASYIPVDSVRFGAGLQLFFFDTPSIGGIIAFDVAAEITVFEKGFIFEMNGNATIANVIVTYKGKKIISRSLANATGYICYNSIENHLVGLFNANTNTSPLLCAGGELSVDIGNGQWAIAIGTREKPIFVDIFCLKKPIFQGWFAISNSGLDLGLMVYIDTRIESPWIGFTGFKVKPWAAFKFDFGATAIVYWKPEFAIKEAHVWIDIYAGIGVKYEFLFSSGNLTIAAINLGGEVLFTTIPETYIKGGMHGRVTVFNVSVGFELEVSHKFS